MGSANYVISKFGGQSALAKAIGKRPGTVQHWAKTGIIPAKWHEMILQLARERSIDISPADLVQPPTQLVISGPKEVASLPIARWPGVLPIGDYELPVYVLNDGSRVISRTGASGLLTGRQVGGKLESYLLTQAIRPYLPDDVTSHFIEFTMPGVVNKTVLGVTAETFLEICRAYAKARDEGALQTPTQINIGIRAGMLLAACAKTGLIALIDEVTGHQYERAEDALRLKLKLYLEEEMRKWEKTFPDELWKEFGRLTNWRGPLHERPKYWGKLVMELVYDYLDPDVSDWLKKNNPQPQKGKNYHQWLSSQYGLKKLIEHLWMLIGMASACSSITELRQKLAEKFGRIPIQYTMYLPPANEPGQPVLIPAKRKALPGRQNLEKQAALPIESD
jgi:hypothetical protein